MRKPDGQVIPPPGLHCGPAGRRALKDWFEFNYVNSDKMNDNPAPRSCMIWRETQCFQDVVARNCVDFLKLMGLKRNRAVKELFDLLLDRLILKMDRKKDVSDDQWIPLAEAVLPMIQVPQLLPAIAKLLSMPSKLPPRIIQAICVDTPSAFAFYRAVPLKVKRQMWVKRKGLFLEYVNPIFDDFLRKIHFDYDSIRWVFSGTAINTPWQGSTKPQSEGGEMINNAGYSSLLEPIDELIDLIGDSHEMYDLCVKAIRHRFIQSCLPGSYHVTAAGGGAAAAVACAPQDKDSTTLDGPRLIYEPYWSTLRVRLALRVNQRSSTAISGLTISEVDPWWPCLHLADKIASFGFNGEAVMGLLRSLLRTVKIRNREDLFDLSFIFLDPYVNVACVEGLSLILSKSDNIIGAPLLRQAVALSVLGLSAPYIGAVLHLSAHAAAAKLYRVADVGQHTRIDRPITAAGCREPATEGGSKHNTTAGSSANLQTSFRESLRKRRRASKSDATSEAKSSIVMRKIDGTRVKRNTSGSISESSMSTGHLRFGDLLGYLKDSSTNRYQLFRLYVPPFDWKVFDTFVRKIDSYFLVVAGDPQIKNELRSQFSKAACNEHPPYSILNALLVAALEDLPKTPTVTGPDNLSSSVSSPSSSCSYSPSAVVPPSSTTSAPLHAFRPSLTGTGCYVLCRGGSFEYVGEPTSSLVLGYGRTACHLGRLLVIVLMCMGTLERQPILQKRMMTDFTGSLKRMGGKPADWICILGLKMLVKLQQQHKGLFNKEALDSLGSATLPDTTMSDKISCRHVVEFLRSQAVSETMDLSTRRFQLKKAWRLAHWKSTEGGRRQKGAFVEENQLDPSVEYIEWVGLIEALRRTLKMETGELDIPEDEEGKKKKTTEKGLEKSASHPGGGKSSRKRGQTTPDRGKEQTKKLQRPIDNR